MLSALSVTFSPSGGTFSGAIELIHVANKNTLMQKAFRKQYCTEKTQRAALMRGYCFRYWSNEKRCTSLYDAAWCRGKVKLANLWNWVQLSVREVPQLLYVRAAYPPVFCTHLYKSVGIHPAEVSPLQVMLNHYQLQWHCSVIDPALSDL